MIGIERRFVANGDFINANQYDYEGSQNVFYL